MPTLKLVATRDITLGDIAAAARAVGRPLLHYDGRINLTNPDGPHRDVSFKGVTRRVFERANFALTDPATFDMPPNTVVFNVAGRNHLAERWVNVDFRVRSSAPGDFTAVELNTVLDAVAEAFGARPVVIFNREVLGGQGTPTDADTDVAVNDFYGFDVKAAAEEWTFPHPTRWPDAHEERLFECWRCSAVRPASSFSRKDDLIDNPMNDVLGSIVLDCTSTACDMCVRDLTERPPMRPRKRKADVLKGLTTNSSFDHGGCWNNTTSGKWMFEVQVMVTGHPIKCSTFHHVGYMNRGWPSKQAAADAYKKEFPHMRVIRKEFNWTSDWDPITRLRFVIRELTNVERLIKCTWR